MAEAVIEGSPQISGMLRDRLWRNAEGGPIHGLEDFFFGTLIFSFHFFWWILHILGEGSEEPIESLTIGIRIFPSAFMREDVELGLMEVSLNKEEKYCPFDFVIIEYISSGVEWIRSKLIRRERLFGFFAFFLLLSLPFDIMFSFVRVTDVFDRLEVITDHSWLDVCLQLTWLRFHPSVFHAESLRVFFGISLFLIGIRRFMKKGVWVGRIKLFLMWTQFAIEVVFPYVSVRLFHKLVRFTSGGQAIKWS